MNQSTLEKAKELDASIKELTKKLRYWETATKISLTLSSEAFSINVSVTNNVDFQEFQKIRIAQIKKELSKAEHEFKCL